MITIQFFGFLYRCLKNSIFAVDHEISPEDMIDITEMIIAFEKKH